MLEELIAEKNRVGDERDLCAELYNLWITRLYEYENDKVLYKKYMDLIAMFEPHANSLKEEIRVLNRKICELEGVDSIGDTDYVRECNNAHGLDKPNAE